jgi:hypothetical protein
VHLLILLVQDRGEGILLSLPVPCREVLFRVVSPPYGRIMHWTTFNPRCFAPNLLWFGTLFGGDQARCGLPRPLGSCSLERGMNPCEQQRTGDPIRGQHGEVSRAKPDIGRTYQILIL